MAKKKAKYSGIEYDRTRSEEACFESIVGALKKRHGVGSVSLAAAAGGLETPMIATGVFGLDLQTGVHRGTWSSGVPAGRITMFLGDPSTGKTTLAIKVVAQAQRTCRVCKTRIRGRLQGGFEHKLIRTDTGEEVPVPKKVRKRFDDLVWTDVPAAIEAVREEAKIPEDVAVEVEAYLCESEPVCDCGRSEPMRVVWFDPEGTLDRGWAEHHGVYLDRLWVVATETAEQGMDAALAMIQGGGVDMLVIDSIAALTPKKEVEEGMDEWQVGLHARLMNKALRKINSALNQKGILTCNRPTFLFINQKRVNIGGWGDPTTYPGGKGLTFASSVEVSLAHGEKEQVIAKPKKSAESQGEAQDGDATEDAEDAERAAKKSIKVTVAKTTKFKITKNKCGAPHGEGAFRMWVREYRGHTVGDTEEADTVFNLADAYGVLAEGESGCVSVPGLDVEFPDRKTLHEHLVRSEAFLWHLREAVARAFVSAVI